MGRKLDHRSDLFSLGTLLYEMLTLQAPFQAPTEIELIFAVRDARKRPVRELRPDVNPLLEDIVDRAMARSRSQRYQSGEELAQALESFLREFYGDFRRSNFGRYMRNTFGREIERELRMLEEFVIDGGRAEEVGENLLADVLGPDAPYTQFTAAFNEGAADLPTGAGQGGAMKSAVDLGDQQTGPTPLSQKARPERPAAGPRPTLVRHLDAGWGLDSPVDAPGRAPALRPGEAVPALGGAAPPSVEVAPPSARAPSRPLAPPGPRVTAMGPLVDLQARRPDGARDLQPRPPDGARDLGGLRPTGAQPLRTEVEPPQRALDVGDEASLAEQVLDNPFAPLTTDPQLGEATDLPVEQTQIGEPPEEPGDLHAEQTRIISRDAVGLHDAATRIFDVRKLSPEMQGLLAGAFGNQPQGGRPPSVSVAPSYMTEQKAPTPMVLPQGVDLHDADTQFLHRAAMDQLGVSAADLRSPPKVESTAQVRMPGERRGEAFARPESGPAPGVAAAVPLDEPTGPRQVPPPRVAPAADAPEPSVILDDSDLLME